MKQRFEDAQVGDTVYCRLYGPGKIIELNHDPAATFPVLVLMEKNSRVYEISGRYDFDTVEPTLFYRIGACRYLTARPSNGSKQAFRECRECLGLDRVAMADVLGVSRHTVRNWETEKHPNTPPDWVWKLIERLYVIP